MACTHWSTSNLRTMSLAIEFGDRVLPTSQKCRLELVLSAQEDAFRGGKFPSLCPPGSGLRIDADYRPDVVRLTTARVMPHTHPVNGARLTPARRI
jgi:hypothetical protein